MTFQNRIPDPVDYVEMRRNTFGSELTMSLSRLTHGVLVPPEVFDAALKARDQYRAQRR